MVLFCYPCVAARLQIATSRNPTLHFNFNVSYPNLARRYLDSPIVLLHWPVVWTVDNSFMMYAFLIKIYNLSWLIYFWFDYINNDKLLQQIEVYIKITTMISQIHLRGHAAQFFCRMWALVYIFICYSFRSDLFEWMQLVSFHVWL